MMELKLQQLITWFEDQITVCNEHQQSLLADDRSDEATFEKIKANVYDIFRTILSVANNTCRGDANEVKNFFLLKAEQIPASWIASHEKAKQHGDIEKMQIESLKLDTIREIRAKFIEIWEEQNE